MDPFLEPTPASRKEKLTNTKRNQPFTGRRRSHDPCHAPLRRVPG